MVIMKFPSWLRKSTHHFCCSPGYMGYPSFRLISKALHTVMNGRFRKSAIVPPASVTWSHQECSTPADFIALSFIEKHSCFLLNPAYGELQPRQSTHFLNFIFSSSIPTGNSCLQVSISSIPTSLLSVECRNSKRVIR